MKVIKIYGERNTNTNYMSKLIELNLKAKELRGIVPHRVSYLQQKLPGRELVRDIYFKLSYRSNLGWKHSCVGSAQKLNKLSIVKSGISFISITKNPYSWLLSLYDNPYHQYYNTKPDFKTFLQTPWKTVGRDNVSIVLNNPMELWNIKNSSYLELKELNGLNISTESMFEDPKKVIDKISDHFNIEKYSTSFINYEKSTKDASKNSDYYKEYYLREKWRDLMSKNEIKIINESIDKELMSYFKYEVLK